MPPKPIISAGKGQQSLFSFFNKPAVQVSAEKNEVKEPKSMAPQTPSASSILQGVETANEFKSATTRDVDSDGDLEALKSVVKTIAPPTETKPIRPKAKKNVLVDSDEEWDDAKDTIKEEAGPSSKKAKTVSNNDDDLCDSDDKESAYKDDENGSDDNNDDEDSFIDEDSDDEAEARRKKAKKAKSTPNTAAKSTPKASAKTTPSSKTTTSIATGSKPKTTAVFGIATPASKTASVSDTNPSCEDLQLPEGVVGAGSHEHNSWDWFKPANRRDSEKRKMSDPNYDHRTVLVPDSFLKEQTPAMLQWWTFKKDNLDSVLFFKVGKFYELFHMDADVGVADLDLIYMKGAKAHSGFPEVSYGKFAATLVSKGHRVARVEQTETPDMLKERNDRAVGKKDKVVAREICSIMSKGTRTYCHLDDLTLFNDASVAGSGSQSSILVCIKEKTSFIESNADMIDSDSDPVVSKVEVPEYGVCVVDTVLGTITLAQFQDDLLRSRLRTMLASHTPNEVLLEKNTYSAQTLGVVRLVAPQALVESLRSDGTEMPSSGHTVIKTLTDAQYFGPKSSIQSIDSWPDILKAVLSGLSDGSSELAVCALGGAVWQMQRALIDFEVLSMKRFYGYVPPDEAVVTATEGIENSDTFHNSTWASKILSCGSVTNNFGAVTDNDAMVVDENTPVSTTPAAAANISSGPSAMILDAVALSNLEILQNNFDHTEKGSLWAFVNRCKTPFGQRCMKEWLCHPLYQSKHIQTRTNAIEELLTVYESQAEETRNILKNVADLERLLSRVHSNSLKRKGPIAHPDSRAIMYEDQIYNSRKIKDFIDILSGFEILLKIENIFAKTSPKSILLQKIVKDKAYSQNQGTSQSQGRFPAAEMSKLLKFFRDIFDEKQAKANGFIKPKPGVDQDFDTAKADGARIEKELEQYLREMKAKTGISDIKYWGSNKDRYQLEVELSRTSRVPADWSAKSQKKSHRRYWTPFIEEKLAELMDAEDRVEAAQKDTLRKIFEKFDENRHIWSDAVVCASTLDALLSMAQVSSSPHYTWPVILSPDECTVPTLDIREGRHPMLEFTFTQRGDSSYIPNTVVLGGTLGVKNDQNFMDQVTLSSGDNAIHYLPRLLLLSGPNMGGKSTLLRQTCLITIMAQVGFKVPATQCELTPVDRIFTRVGASDRILQGQSTFFVELAETASILKSATKNSLCILDELGRGTATFDGTAIAYAVVEHLVSQTGCRTLFATHYHSLIDDLEMDPRVKLGHMECFVQQPDEVEDGSDGNSTAGSNSGKHKESEEVTFLFRLCDGSSPKSYGINVARLAGLPQAVIQIAMRQSEKFESQMKAAELSEQQAVTIPSNGSSLGLSQKTIILNKRRREKIQSYFEKLVSLAESTVPVAELTYYAEELWNRYVSAHTSFEVNVM